MLHAQKWVSSTYVLVRSFFDTFTCSELPSYNRSNYLKLILAIFLQHKCRKKICLWLEFCWGGFQSPGTQIMSLESSCHNNHQNISFSQNLSNLEITSKPFGTWQNWCFGQFHHSRIEVFKIAQVLAKDDNPVIIVSA